MNGGEGYEKEKDDVKHSVLEQGERGAGHIIAYIFNVRVVLFCQDTTM